MTIKEKIVRKILELRISTSASLASLKRKFAKKYGKPIPSNVELLREYHKLLKTGSIKRSKNLEELLRLRKVRSLSGIAVVSVLTKPYPCPGKCLYCPTQKGIPKSYLDNEPAVMRAVLNKFDPYSQVKTRLQALKNIGHPTDKIELIVIGGTWSYLPKNYQTWFVTRCFAACNADLRGSKRGTTRKIKSLKEEQKRNEKAKNRIIGITLETRPDFIDEKEIKRMRKLGATRVEIGVQSLYDDVLKLNRRGHKIEAVIKATHLLKDAGFKVCYHMMPNLPGSNPNRDRKMFEELWSSLDFRPDLLKIYPCALLKESFLYRWWKNKKYKPYSKKQLINLLKTIKKEVPYYVRIQRITRDIPSPSIVTGPTKISNLRQILAEESKQEGWKCKCIRCREVREDYNLKEKLVLFREDYEASSGKEIFLSFENKNREKLYSLLRLRVPQVFAGRKHFIPILQDAAIIREVHTYGQLVPISVKQKIAAQHKGLGKKLIKEAEKIIYTEFGRSTKKEFGNSRGRIRISRGRKAERALFACKKIAVISGVGARDYFQNLGYQLKNDYMIKNL